MDMNTTGQSPDETESGGYYFVNFNQDYSSLSVGSRDGFKIYALQSIVDSNPNGPQNLECIYEHTGEEICIVERLFSSSLVAVVSVAAPRKLRVCHFKKGTEICTYSYTNTILAVKLNRSRLIVCLEEALYIHNIRDMKVLHTIRETPPNPLGLCALANSSSNCFLAYPGSSTTGEVQIFDTVNLHAKIMIMAHDSPLAALGFSPNGTSIATASEKGTVIRVFNVADGSKLYEFRRGVKRCVSISSLTFSTDAQFLCTSSNTETVHIFKLEETKEVPPKQQPEEGWMDYLSKAVTAGANMLPGGVSTMLNQGRAFATAYLPITGVRNVLAITTIQRVMRLLVACSDGNLYIFNMDPEVGGPLNLTKRCHLAGDAAPLEGGPETSIPTHSASESDSDKLHEIAAAIDLPPKGGFRFDDDQEFPPFTHKSE